MKKISLSLREAIDTALVIIGVTIIAVRVLSIADSGNDMVVVAVGIMMIYLGVWGLGTHLLPSRRIFSHLRSEVDDFLSLVRKLNTHSVNGESALVDATKTEMREAIEQMAAAAGVAD